MSRSFRSSSLLWTFVLSFLLVLVVATLLQGVVVVAVVNSLADRTAVDRAEVMAREAGGRLDTLDRNATTADIAEALRRHNPPAGPVVLLFRASDGRLLPEHWLPPPVHRRLQSFLAGSPDSAKPVPFSAPGAHSGGLPPPGANGQPPDWPGPPPGANGPPEGLPGPPPAGQVGARGSRQLPRAGRPPLPGVRPEDLVGRPLKVLGRYTLQRTDELSGEVVALTTTRPFAFWPEGTMRRILLFLPFAILLAGAAGTVLFRSLIRRLKTIENLAARITDGDLEARVPESSDEIGRLGARLNRMTDALATARRKVAESDRQRRQLLADITHELTTPLTSIRGYAETLLDPAVPVSSEERLAYLRNVLDESERMNLLLQDLFDLTRLESGVTSLTPVPLDCTALCLNTLDRYQPRFRGAGIELLWDGSRGAAWVSADGRRLEQVLDNLLVNALRYVPGGGSVVLSVARLGDGLSTKVRLTVRDDGPGVSPEDLPHLFDRFYRADPSRSTGGSGLGLAIVKEIVTRHGGAVRAERVEPTGTAIIVDLPAIGEPPA